MFGGAVFPCRRIHSGQGTVHPQLSQHIFRRGGDEGGQQDAQDPDALQQIVEHRLQTRPLLLLLGQQPRGGLVDILVAAPGQIHQRLQGVGVAVAVHQPAVTLHRLPNGCAQLPILRERLGRPGNHAAEIFVGHGDAAVGQIAQGVGQIRVVAGDEAFIGDGAVLGVGHLRQQIIPHRIGAEAVGQLVGVQHIAAGFAHLVLAGQHPGMAQHLLRQRLAQGHQDDGPVDGVKADDILADDMQIRRPIAGVFLPAAIGMIAQAGDIVGQSVQPDVDHMIRVKVHRDPPLEGGAGNAEIGKAGLEEIIDHFVAPGIGFDEVRVVLIVLQQLVLIF